MVIGKLLLFTETSS